MAQAGKAAKPNVFARVRSYFKHVSTELKRVVWPGRTEVINSSFVVVVTLLFFVAFTFIVDSLSSWLFIDLLAGIGR
ncbi:MAG: preprotein translocase subunit SecE [Coriobacteriia bacterium]